MSISATIRANNKIQGSFYALQREELISLRKSRLINNAAFVHFALRMTNPFCDRPIELIPSEFAEKWEMAVSSVYEAIGRLKSKGIVEIQTGKITLTWSERGDRKVRSSQNKSNRNVSDQNASAENLELHHSEKSELILRSQNQLQKPRINSENSEIEAPEPLPDKEFDFSQTVSKDPDLQTSEEGAGKEIKSVSSVNYSVQTEAPGLTSVGDTLAQPTPEPTPALPQDLRNRLGKLGIELDDRTNREVTKYHLSQIRGAIAHVEKTWETIDNARSVFLYQLPKQKVAIERKQGNIKTARDFPGYSLEHLQDMYPNNWQEAARHFGLEIEGDEADV